MLSVPHNIVMAMNREWLFVYDDSSIKRIWTSLCSFSKTEGLGLNPWFHLLHFTNKLCFHIPNGCICIDIRSSKYLVQVSGKLEFQSNKLGFEARRGRSYGASDLSQIAMPRPKKGASSAAVNEQVTPATPAVPACIRSLPNSTVGISVHAKPGSKLSAISGNSPSNSRFLVEFLSLQRKMTPMLPPTWIIVLLHVRVDLSLYVIP